jgi:hypothetical protein
MDESAILRIIDDEDEQEMSKGWDVISKDEPKLAMAPDSGLGSSASEGFEIYKLILRGKRKIFGQ